MLSWIFTCQLLAVAVASFSSECSLQTTPRFLYMKKQVDSFMTEPDTKLSVSIDPTQVHAEFGDVVHQGFRVAKNSKMQLSFDLSKAAENKANFDKSELWLFLYQSTEDAKKDGLVDLTFHVTAQALTSTKKTAVTYSWNTEDSVISLDVTTVMKRLLKKKIDNLAEILLTIETTRMEVSEQNGQKNKELEKVFEAMENRECSTPFLVFKYFSEEAVPDTPTLSVSDFVDLRPRPEAGEESPNKRNAHGSLALHPNETVISVNEMEEITTCSRRNLSFNFTKLLPIVIAPPLVDIGMCSGECPLRGTTHTVHSQMMELLGFQQGSCCFPSAFSSISVLIHLDDTFILRLLDDVVVTSCSCTNFLE